MKKKDENITKFQWNYLPSGIKADSYPFADQTKLTS